MTNKIGVSAPSNIAFIKYWGKKEDQKPINPSLSMTLKNCRTEMQVEFLPRKEKLLSEVKLSGVQNDQFQESLSKRISRLKDTLPWLSDYSLKIDSVNTFPHSAGIASSASSMAALAHILVLKEKEMKKVFSLERASHIARLLSGSACRSLYGKFVSWGEESELHASPFGHIHPELEDLRDTILIVDKGQKKISSSEGHKLIDNHPFKKGRIYQANDNFKELRHAFEIGDFTKIDMITRSEALSLHALMMSSRPSYFLIKPESLKLIELIDDFKAQTKLPLTYTLDAGPNIHLIYPKKADEQVKPFIESILKPYCDNSQVIYDQMGSGPSVLE